MTWYDQDKCADFLKDTNKHFREAKIIIFDIIHKKCRGEVVPPDLLKYYQTINENAVSEIHSSAFVTDRKDLFFEKETIKKHLKK